MSKINITKIRLCTKCNKSSNEVNMGKTVNKKTNKEYFNCICYPCQYLRNKQYQVKKLDNTIFIKDMILEIVEHIIEKEPEKKNKVCVICNKTSDKVKIIRFLDRINKQNLNSICVSCKDIKVGKNKINREESRKTKVKL